jgi:hypothetical protein
MKWLILSPLCEVGDCLPGWLESELDTGRIARKIELE